VNDPRSLIELRVHVSGKEGEADDGQLPAVHRDGVTHLRGEISRGRRPEDNLLPCFGNPAVQRDEPDRRACVRNDGEGRDTDVADLHDPAKHGRDRSDARRGTNSVDDGGLHAGQGHVLVVRDHGRVPCNSRHLRVAQ
jgi:hypothetical protein